MGRKKKAPQTDIIDRIFCWYCDRDFQEEKILASHQKEKHFKCQWCNKRLMSVKGLVVHAQQVHKEEVTRVPNAIEGRDSIEHDVFGMEGIPQSYWEEQARKRSKLGGPLPPSILNGLGAGPYGYVPHMPFTALYGASPLAGYPRIPTSQYANPYAVPATPVPPPVVAPGEIPAAPQTPLPTQYSALPTIGPYAMASTAPLAAASYAPPPPLSSSPMVPGQNSNVAAFANSQVYYQSSPVMQSSPGEMSSKAGSLSEGISYSGSGSSLPNEKSDSRISKEIGNNTISNQVGSKSAVSNASSQSNAGKALKVRVVFCPVDEETSMEELRAQLPRYQRHMISS